MLQRKQGGIGEWRSGRRAGKVEDVAVVREMTVRNTIRRADSAATFAQCWMLLPLVVFEQRRLEAYYDAGQGPGSPW